VSDTVTIRNHGPGTRWVWLSLAQVYERKDAGASDALSLTVLDVSDVGSPASVYRGPAAGLGARPLGFLAPGASRTYSFTADLPVNGPARTSSDRRAGADLTYAWHAIAGKAAATPAPAAPRPAPARSDTRAPGLRFRAPARQQVLRDATLSVRTRCSETCRLQARARVWGAGARSRAAVTGDGGRRRVRMLRVHLGPRALGVVRRALVSHRVAKVRLAVSARDRAGNRRRSAFTVRLLPQG
jgi:hypothetical protein